ncbi:MAG: hypothetical protein APF84_15055 [Gracilibacter sp. BRH_c7a]|nr:MAG: hypothetical protein APF84_15055 [Gracilibacter sp. BRH_c7a]
MFYAVIPWIENKDYYFYLVKISWPAIIGLFIIYMFIFLRFLHNFRYYREGKSDKNRFGLLGLRLVISIMVIAIYQDMFAKSYPDWLEQPGISYGVVYSLETYHNSRSYDYIISIRDGDNKLSFKVDKIIFDELQLEDEIQIEYLPIKKDVFRCTILT